MFEMLGYAILVPIQLAIDIVHWIGRYRNFHQRLEPRERELSKTSHGAGVLAICALLLNTIGAAAAEEFADALQASSDLRYWIPALLFAGAVLWGATWFLSGVNRSLAYAGFRDSRLINRALVKIAAGGGLYWLIWHPPASWWLSARASLAVARSLTWPCFMIEAVMLWLIVTGAVKLLLLLWQRRSLARVLVEQDIAAQQFDWNRRP
jgi:hypothetical protein